MSIWCVQHMETHWMLIIIVEHFTFVLFGMLAQLSLARTHLNLPPKICWETGNGSTISVRNLKSTFRNWSASIKIYRSVSYKWPKKVKIVQHNERHFYAWGSPCLFIVISTRTHRTPNRIKMYIVYRFEKEQHNELFMRFGVFSVYRECARLLARALVSWNIHCEFRLRPSTDPIYSIFVCLCTILFLLLAVLWTIILRYYFELRSIRWKYVFQMVERRRFVCTHVCTVRRSERENGNKLCLSHAGWTH